MNETDHHTSNDDVPPIIRQKILDEFQKGTPIKEISKKAGLDLAKTMRILKRIQRPIVKKDLQQREKAKL